MKSLKMKSAKIKSLPAGSKGKLLLPQGIPAVFWETMIILFPIFGLPKWTDIIDPSARELDGYSE